LGHKTNLDYIWRNGILVETPEGWFRLEANYDEKEIDLFIEKPAVQKWVDTIIQIVEGNDYREDIRELKNWTYSEDQEDLFKKGESIRPEGTLPDIKQQEMDIVRIITERISKEIRKQHIVTRESSNADKK